MQRNCDSEHRWRGIGMTLTERVRCPYCLPSCRVRWLCTPTRPSPSLCTRTHARTHVHPKPMKHANELIRHCLRVWAITRLVDVIRAATSIQMPQSRAWGTRTLERVEFAFVIRGHDAATLLTTMLQLLQSHGDDPSDRELCRILFRLCKDLRARDYPRVWE
jgi:hypothetical protein